MNTYPYFGGIDNDTVTLFIDENTGFIIEHPKLKEKFRLDDDWIEDEFKNITTEYLANTYGKVKSKDHAEFIAELAKAHGIEVKERWVEGDFFCFHRDICKKPILGFYDEEAACDEGEKLIIIPMPPKEVEEIPEHNVLQDRKIECNSDEWPKIGDDFIHKDELVTCISKGFMSNGDEVITFECADKLSHGSCWNIDAWVKKPKTPEEELRDDIVQLIDDADGLSSYVLTLALMDKYDIKKKPQ